MPSVLTSLIRWGVKGLLQTITARPISGLIPAVFISTRECLASATRRHDTASPGATFGWVHHLGHFPHKNKAKLP